MQRRRISWTEVERELNGTMTASDKQWCLEEAIDIVKEAASSGATDLPALLESVYEKLKELGADAFGEGRIVPSSEQQEKSG